ncbi:MAG: hemolysin III family protein [Salinivirgaceae bacterium]|nr:hemolysin III family protein [Salinivirgaceae bacterium]
MSIQTTIYNIKEERINTWSHFFGLILSVIGLILLLQKAFELKSMMHIISYAIFGLSMIILYLASTLYHGAKDLEKRKKLNVFDHIAIYFLIAGTYTPLTMLVLKGVWGWSIFGAVWGIACVGLVLKLFFTGRFNLASTISYVLMGWVIVIAIKPLLANLSTQGFIWLGIGGAFYSIGAIFYSIKKIPYNHATFHFFVLGGSISHFIAIYWYI